MHECMDGWMDGWNGMEWNGWMDVRGGWMDGWRDGGMEEWRDELNGRMDGWTLDHGRTTMDYRLYVTQGRKEWALEWNATHISTYWLHCYHVTMPTALHFTLYARAHALAQRHNATQH